MNSLLQNSDLKKVQKPTSSFKYKLNQIPYDHTVEVTNRSKRSDLVHRVPKELQTEEAMTKTMPKKKKCKR